MTRCCHAGNRPDGPFAVEGTDGIRTGLDAIATLPGEVKQRLLAERNERGPFRDLADFRGRILPGTEALTTLIYLRRDGLHRPESPGAVPSNGHPGPEKCRG